MKVLITGIGISGKSTLRRRMVKICRSVGLKTEHYDADGFKKIRHPDDDDCLAELPCEFHGETVYIIEDIHATYPDKAVYPLGEYDYIFYIVPDRMSHIKFWLSRMRIWFATGKFLWEQDSGWRGSGRPRDFTNILPMMKELWRNMINRDGWIKQDLQTLHSARYVILQSKWTPSGPSFSITSSRLIF